MAQACAIRSHRPGNYGGLPYVTPLVAWDLFEPSQTTRLNDSRGSDISTLILLAQLATKTDSSSLGLEGIGVPSSM